MTRLKPWLPVFRTLGLLALIPIAATQFYVLYAELTGAPPAIHRLVNLWSLMIVTMWVWPAAVIPLGIVALAGSATVTWENTAWFHGSIVLMQLVMAGVWWGAAGSHFHRWMWGEKKALLHREQRPRWDRGWPSLVAGHLYVVGALTNLGGASKAAYDAWLFGAEPMDPWKTAPAADIASLVGTLQIELAMLVGFCVLVGFVLTLKQPAA